MKVFVIIVTYKGQQWYDHCFTSLRASTIPLQLVVVDNTPGNEDANYIKTHFPEVNLIKPKENLGFGKANNLGMRYALDNGCDYVFLLNQDAWIEPDSIEKLVNIHTEHPEFGVISPMHLTKEKNHLNILFDDGHANYEILSDAYCGVIKDYYPVKYVNAAAWLLPRKTLEILGGFDPIYKHYEEDDDYLNRAIYHHVPIVLCPNIRVVHDHTTLQKEYVQFKGRHYQFIILDHTNINKPEHIGSHLRYLMRKMVVTICQGQLSKYKQYRDDYRFLRSMKARIIQSRINNVEKKQNWL